MNTARLRLVTSFDELRAGDFVEVRACTVCGGSHRRILSGRRVTPASGFVCAPTAEFCEGWLDVYSAHGLPAHVCPVAVDERRVFLVDTGLETGDRVGAAARRPRAVRA